MLRNAMRLVSLLLGFLLPGLSVQAAETRFTVEVRGQGPEVILIPGLASSRGVWSGLVSDLSRDHRLHLIQVNGFAGAPSGANATGPVVEGLVEDLAKYIRDAGLKRPAVIGHSMGGFTGLALASRHPDSLGRLMVVDALPFFSVLINPSATAQSIEPRATEVRRNFETMTEADLVKVQTDTLQRLVKSEQGRIDALAWSLTSDRMVVGQVTYDIMTSDLRPTLGRIAVPVTVLIARDDSMGLVAGFVEPVYRSNYAGLPGVRLVPIDGALHFIMLDQPEAFAREVRTFLKQPAG